jgi:RNA polymerase sigma-70 factor, ECF subfamily
MDATATPAAPEAVSPCYDADLLAQVADEGPRALADVHDRYRGLIRSEALRILGDPDEAEDVVQEVLLKVWRYAGAYDPRRANVCTWIAVMARRCAIDHLRRRQRRLELASEPPSPEDVAFFPEVFERVDVMSRFERLRRELRKLPREQQRVLHLAFFHDMSQQEIALATGMPLGTVKSRTNSALRKLRGALPGVEARLAS